MNDRICKYCGSDKYGWNSQKRQYLCSACHLESSYDFSTRRETPPTAGGTSPATQSADCVDTYTDEHGKTQEVSAYMVGVLPADRIPERKVNLEHAEFVKWRLAEQIAANRRYAAQDLRKRGFKRTRRKRWVNNRHLYIWYTEKYADYFSDQG